MSLTGCSLEQKPDLSRLDRKAPEPIEYETSRALPVVSMEACPEAPEHSQVSILSPVEQARTILWVITRYSSGLAECRTKHEDLVRWILEGEDQND